MQEPYLIFFLLLLQHKLVVVLFTVSDELEVPSTIIDKISVRPIPFPI